MKSVRIIIVITVTGVLTGTALVIGGVSSLNIWHP
jgi:hypothetical protein